MSNIQLLRLGLVLIIPVVFTVIPYMIGKLLCSGINLKNDAAIAYYGIGVISIIICIMAVTLLVIVIKASYRFVKYGENL